MSPELIRQFEDIEYGTTTSAVGSDEAVKAETQSSEREVITNDSDRQIKIVEENYDKRVLLKDKMKIEFNNGTTQVR